MKPSFMIEAYIKQQKQHCLWDKVLYLTKIQIETIFTLWGPKMASTLSPVLCFLYSLTPSILYDVIHILFSIFSDTKSTNFHMHALHKSSFDSKTYQHISRAFFDFETMQTCCICKKQEYIPFTQNSININHTNRLILTQAGIIICTEETSIHLTSLHYVIQRLLKRWAQNNLKPFPAPLHKV